MPNLIVNRYKETIRSYFNKQILFMLNIGDIDILGLHLVNPKIEDN